ncbi:uncharacterized protein LOC113320486 isoform X2 [Papaver somniferum]|uniref:uncharacterized protein LOC113320486 isoform X2 n=1 Tax=Papaver somniferum TaxID=3469 RepID=UPI000E6FAF21|nr:uncharacterized protein LOC113320486 isoform X2 [Papaver somniferum]
MMNVWVFKKKNINNCRRSTRLKARSYINSFTWIKVFSNKLDSGSKCQLLSLTATEIILWQNGVISCYDLKPITSTKLWCTEGANGVTSTNRSRGCNCRKSHMDDEYVNANQRDPTILITISVASPPVILGNFCSRVKRQAVS